MLLGRARNPLAYTLIRDVFTTARAAGSLNNTAAEPGAGTRLVADTQTKMSISGGAVVVSGGRASPGFGDPAWYYTPGFARAAGRTAIFSFVMHSGESQGAYLGWTHNAPPSSVSSFRDKGLNFTGTQFRAWDNTNIPVIGAIATETVYECAIVLFSTGALVFLRGGAFGNDWCLLFPYNTGTQTPLNIGWQTYNTVFDVLAASATDITAWTSYTANATAYTASPTAGAAVTALRESVIEFTWTPAANDTLELDVLRLDANNRWIVRGSQAGSTCKLIQREAGAETERATAAQTWIPGTPYRVVVVQDIKSIRVLVENVVKAGITGSTAAYRSGGTTVQTSHAGANLTVRPLRVDLWHGSGIEADSIERAYGTNVSTYLTTPTYDGSGQATHPDVIDFGVGQTWNGYRYWMAMTPYPSSNNLYENPSILVSNDNSTWIAPPGLTNPIAAHPADGFNSDVDLTMVGSTMYLYYRQYTASNSGHILWLMSSTDGVTWSAPQSIINQANQQDVAPAIVYYGGQYLMFAIDDLATNVVTRRTAPTIAGPWSAAVVVPFALPGSNEPWHMDVCVDATRARLWASMSTFASELYLAYSDDGGSTWSVGTKPVIPGAGWSTAIYRSCIKAQNGYLDCWYSGYTGVPNVWHVGYTKIWL